ncbi:hypothetical protein F751_3488 [Auxenochlorella protothecoides]|uniref:Uncharacterized protein n=1 Tax=Auxenochlorella protothecoides TaxID=3075 RepID=A0A087SSF4_AUXPR|nr:hypothetical protein F751_3488 [Auxenochlorella protothecoides]KFM28658.1 hypothetical protein F751_3488 [Auxenochlorella protothecoides]
MEPGWLRRTRIGVLAALCICSLFGHARAALDDPCTAFPVTLNVSDYEMGWGGELMLNLTSAGPDLLKHAQIWVRTSVNTSDQASLLPVAAADHAWRRLLGRTDRRWHLPFPPPAPLDVILYRTACPPIFAAAAILGPGSGAVLDQAPRAGLATSSQAGRQRVDLAQAAASPEQGAADPPSEVALLLPPPSPTALEQSPALASPEGGGSEGQSPPTPAAATAAGAPASDPGTNQTLYIALGAGIGGALVLGTAIGLLFYRCMRRRPPAAVSEGDKSSDAIVPYVPPHDWQSSNGRNRDAFSDKATPLHGPLDSASQPSLEPGPEGPRALPYLVSTPSMQEEEAAKENLRPKWARMVPRSLASSLSSVHSVVYSPERPSLRLNGAFDPEALPLSDIELSPVPSSLTSPGESERRYSPPSPVAPSPDRGPRAGHRAATRAKRVMFREPERSPGGGVHAWTGSTGRRGPGGANGAAHDPEAPWQDWRTMRDSGTSGVLSIRESGEVAGSLHHAAPADPMAKAPGVPSGPPVSHPAPAAPLQVPPAPARPAKAWQDGVARAPAPIGWPLPNSGAGPAPLPPGQKVAPSPPEAPSQLSTSSSDGPWEPPTPLPDPGSAVSLFLPGHKPLRASTASSHNPCSLLTPYSEGGGDWDSPAAYFASSPGPLEGWESNSIGAGRTGGGKNQSTTRDLPESGPKDAGHLAGDDDVWEQYSFHRRDVLVRKHFDA